VSALSARCRRKRTRVVTRDANEYDDRLLATVPACRVPLTLLALTDPAYELIGISNKTFIHQVSTILHCNS
jgi:hypothetical protein